MFIVGVDIAKRSHEAIILDDSGSVVRKAFNFKNDSAGFTKLTAAMTGVSANPEDFIVGISRFSSATKLAAFAGIDPTVKQSGEFTATHNHMSKRGSPYLRRAIWQASTVAVNCDPRLKAFMEKKRAEGKPYMNAIGHVTRKLTNIIYAVLRDNKPYYPRITN